MTDLRIKDCKATPGSIRVFFTDAVKANSPAGQQDHDATNPQNYEIVTPIGSLKQSIVGKTGQITYDEIRQAVYIPLTSNAPVLTPGQFVGVIVSNVQTPRGDGLPPTPPHDSIVVRVDGDDDEEKDIRRIARVTEDSFAFPQLSEEIGYAPSPLARPSGAPSGGGMASLGQTVAQAVSDVLGWKIKPDDSKGFVGALNASFTCSDVDGHTKCTWTPRTYAVQTDLSGGITGAQASLYSRAQDALNQSLPLLDGLYALDPEADPEDITALKGVARSQLTELVNELGMPGGPRVSRVNQYFQLLLQNPEESFPPLPGSSLITDPDQIHGILGKLRDKLGLNFTFQDFANTVQDEQDITNFRILSDYVTSLAQSWLNNLRFFGLDTPTPFFGTQLVLLSRQLSVVAESVDEVRFTLDSVFIGPAERQTLQLQFPGVSNDSLFAEDLFNWIQNFATEEGPRLIQDGGKFGVKFSFLPIAQQLQRLTRSARDPDPLDHAFRTVRVKRALDQLGRELDELVKLAKDISHVIEEEPTKADFDAMRQQLALLTFDVTNIKGLPALPTTPTLVGIPPQVAFSEPQTVNTVSPPEIVSVFNVVSSSATISLISILDDVVDPKSPTPTPTSAPQDFKLIEPNTFSIPLAAGDVLPVAVAFAPTDAKTRTALLTIAYDGGATPSPQSPLRIKLSGTGRTGRK
jgi:hypothetical protein